MNITRKFPAAAARRREKSKGNHNVSLAVATTSVLIAACALTISYLSLSIQDESINIQKNTALSAYLQAYVHLNPVVDVVSGRVTRAVRAQNFIEWQYHLVNRGDMEVASIQNKTRIFIVQDTELLSIDEEEFGLTGNLTVGSMVAIRHNLTLNNIPESGVLCVEDEWKSRINSNSLKYLSHLVSSYFDNMPQITRRLLVRTAIRLSEGEAEDAAVKFCELLSTEQSHQ